MATNPAKIARVVGTCRAAARHYGASTLSVFARVARLKLRERFRPQESFLWGLADPATGEDEIRRVTSRSQLYRLQAVHNPMSLTYLTEEKAVFYAYCTGAGIRTPALFGVYHRDGGWSLVGDRKRLTDRAGWQHFFRDEVPEAFVVKPAKGVYARGLQVLLRSTTGDELTDSSGRPTTIDALLDTLDADRRYDVFVIQERLFNHSELEALSGRHAVQTARVVTLVEGRTPRILFACFKVIAGDGDSDNFDYGRSGNLLADVDVDTGTLHRARGRHESGFGLAEHTSHPETKIEIDGFQLPFWAETRE
ncbi:MAG: sugar-transfer associated ATP-grasp domain-containing protein, partial [Acidobacteriota bacterium]